jgi:tyrosyl-tRNA synthetase
VDVDRQLQLLTAGVVDLISEGELRTKLGRGTPLRVKLGIDPTASDIHLGFAVVLRRLRRFQDLGHTAVLIIGDFTAMVGDPSGKSATRPRLSKDEVDAHAQSYIEQATKILDPSPGKLEVVRNSEWLAKIDMEAVLRLTSQVTVAQMLVRNDFAKRHADGVPISITEFLYPLLQATDSVEVRADVELGGTDQLFNLIMGRDLQKQAGQEPQVVLTTPLLVGLDGEQKMSKSLGNYVGIAEIPSEQFGKIMSIPDAQMPNYFQYATDWTPEQIADVLGKLVSGDLHPNAAKRTLAKAVVALYHGPFAADGAEADFDRVFKEHAAPEAVPEKHVAPGDATVRKLSEWLVLLGLAASRREAGRAIKGGAIKLEGVAQTEDRDYPATELDGNVLQNGKRKWVRLRLQPPDPGVV